MAGNLTDLLAKDSAIDANGPIPMEPYGLRWLVGKRKP